MRSHTLMPRFVVVAAFVISIANSPYARAAENQESNALRTAHSTYTISGTPEREYSQCLYRNRKQLFCGDLNLYFDDVVKTTNYNLIPLHSSCGGNGCPSQDVWLIIERGSKVLVKRVVDDCYLCELKTVRTSPQTDAVNFDIGKKKGYRLTASFRRGNLSVHRTKISSKINKADCEAVYSCFEGCAAENYNCIRTQSEANLWQEVEARHPSFLEKKIFPMCERIHSGALSKDAAFHMFCRITPTWE